MGRPSLPPGTWGVIQIIERDGCFDARTRFRDLNGKTTTVQRRGATKGAASNALRSYLRGRTGGANGDEITADTKVSVLSDLWWKRESVNWPVGTTKTYGSAMKKHVRPAFAELRVAECTPGRIDAALQLIAETTPSSAKTTKAILSGMFSLAVRHGAVLSNPVRDSTAITVPKKRPKALSIDDSELLVDKFRASKLAVALDLPDLVDFMLGTGCRIGEGLAARDGFNVDGEPLLDMESGTWEINGTIVRVPGQGLIVQTRTKTDAGWRRIAIPDYIPEMLLRRESEIRPHAPFGAKFGSPVAHALRDPSNTEGQLKAVLRGLDCELCDERGRLLNDDGKPIRVVKPDGTLANTYVPCDAGPWAWITSHTFRKTVATRLKEAGLSAHQVADHLGHSNPSMTQDNYFGRDVVSAVPATALAKRTTA